MPERKNHRLRLTRKDGLSTCCPMPVLESARFPPLSHVRPSVKAVSRNKDYLSTCVKPRSSFSHDYHGSWCPRNLIKKNEVDSAETMLDGLDWGGLSCIARCSPCPCPEIRVNLTFVLFGGCSSLQMTVCLYSFHIQISAASHTNQCHTADQVVSRRSLTVL